MPLAQGQILQKRYRIAKLIGQGGFGAVYRAWDTALNHPCAVKENFDTSPEAQRQFQWEASVLAGLRHPNLPRVTNHFFIPGQGQYLVMDFVEGENLGQILQRQNGPLPEAQVLLWLEQVCEALEYLHAQQPPIIHRDIKPDNIKITPNDQVMLVDFGIAKVYDSVLSTTIGAKAVTPGFSPPEQYGQGKTDARSDVYALGATLYKLLTTQDPPDAVDRVVGNATLTPPRQINSRIAANTEQAVLRAMESQPSQRLQNIQQFRRALAGHKAPSPPPAPAQPSPAPPAQPSPSPPAQPSPAPPAQPSPPSSPAVGGASTTPNRPLGVTIFSWLLIILGGPASIYLGAGLPGVIAGIWMLKGKNWARRLAIVYAVLLSMVSMILIYAASLDIQRFYWSEYDDDSRYTIYTNEVSAFAVGLVTLFLTLWLCLLIYLFSESARAFFSKRSSHFGTMPRGVEVLGYLYASILSPFILTLIAGIGLAQGKKWGRYMAIGVNTLICLGAFVAGIVGMVELESIPECYGCTDSSFPSFNYYNELEILIGVAAIIFALFAAITFYLNLKEVREGLS